MDDINKMKKAELVCYASELERKLKKAEAEVERIRAEREDKVRAEIRSEEKADWMQTGLQMAQDEIDLLLEDLYLRGEISFDFRYKLNGAVQSVVDGFDVSAIVE